MAKRSKVERCRNCVHCPICGEDAAGHWAAYCRLSAASGVYHRPRAARAILQREAAEKRARGRGKR